MSEYEKRQNRKVLIGWLIALTIFGGAWVKDRYSDHQMNEWVQQNQPYV